MKGITVEPVLSGTVLSGHAPLSGQLSKSRKLRPLITVILTSIKRSPLLSGRGHPLLSPNKLFLLSSSVLNGRFVKGNQSTMVTNIDQATKFQTIYNTDCRILLYKSVSVPCSPLSYYFVAAVFL